MSQASLLGHGRVRDGEYRQWNRLVASFRAEPSLERSRVYLGVDFEGAGQGHANEMFPGETWMWVGEGVGASYPDGWTWRRVGDRTAAVVGSVVKPAEHLAACSAGRVVAGGSFAADVDAVGIASLSVAPGDSSQQAA